ncbi:hypothetical protein [Vibrio crassostreae]|uniref:hypothetical protein n=1 Tax=Vibrio crassostreae TaxID=246167 RepID=UPI000F484202|nr:hypothetical protein [Vibrio crassostreae]ROS66355.1 hypothetical protein EDB73_10589 [Vibrio crassostreae]
MHSSELVFYKLVSREIELAEFEEWVYSSPELEKILNPDDYLELISISYKMPSGLYEAQKILSNYFSLGKYHEWALRNLLGKIVSKPADVHKYIEQSYDLYCEGYDFLDNLGLGYGLSIIHPEDESFSVDKFYPQILDEVSKVIEWLDTGEIEITGHDGEYQGIEYIDKRTAREKEPTAYKVTNTNKKWW